MIGWVEPSRSEIFDGILVKYDREGARVWADEEAGKRPWDGELRGCQAFARLINGRIWPARVKMQEALGLSPSNEWANAVAFVLLPKVDWADPPDEAMWIARCLDEVWILRFECLGFLYEALDLCRYYMTYKDGNSRRRIVADMRHIWEKDPYIRSLIGSGGGV
jgi:hypothetical protein